MLSGNFFLHHKIKKKKSVSKFQKSTTSGHFRVVLLCRAKCKYTHFFDAPSSFLFSTVSVCIQAVS